MTLAGSKAKGLETYLGEGSGVFVGVVKQASRKIGALFFTLLADGAITAADGARVVVAAGRVPASGAATGATEFLTVRDGFVEGHAAKTACGV